jgi:2-methylaconitate cis-trans-isomerase PrpF
MGGATSSTSKVVLVGRSLRDDCDVDYLFGTVSIEAPVIDWSGNCGNLASAGVLLLEFAAGVDRITLKLDGSEIYAVEGDAGSVSPCMTLNVRVTRKTGEVINVPVI